MSKIPGTVVLVKSGPNRPTSQTLIALAFYISLGIYLYYPYFNRFKASEFASLMNSVIAATGCFVLSRRWLSKPAASFFAGAVYGFGPFALSFAAYHPLGGIGFALIPWLFCPAALLQIKTERKIYDIIITGFLSLLPFIAVISLYWLLAQRWIGPFFPLPKQQTLNLTNLADIAAPLSHTGQYFVFGIYHIPLILSLMGLFMYYAAGRIWITVIVAAGLILSCCDSVLQVSPVIWAAIPILFLSILVGMGMQGLTLAGQNDRKWLLFCLTAAGILIVAVLIIALFSGWSKAHQQALWMYGVSLLLTASLYFIVKANARWHFFRWTLICAGAGLDILLGSRYIVDTLF